MRWRIELLGGLRVQSGPRLLPPLRARKAAALLALLAFRPGPHEREVLAELLWPDAEPRAARNRLRVVLSSLRRDLGAAILIAEQSTLALDVAVCRVDVAEFWGALARAKTSGGDERIAAWQAALDLYGGPLLPGFFEDWIPAAEANLEEQFVQTTRAFTAQLRERGQLQLALEYGGRGLARAPLREELCLDVMQLHADLGHPSNALRHYRELEARLWQQWQIAPGAALRELHARLTNWDDGGENIARARDVFAAIRPASPGNEVARRAAFRLPAAPALPPQWTRFFGRETEIAAVRRLLQSPVRLVTLTGAGGGGKTRLALEIARDLVVQEQPSLWFVPLKHLADAGLIPSAIGGAMRLPPIPQMAPLAQLIQVLSGCAQPTLMLDNFEQLLPAGAALVQQLMARVPQLRLLITSRQELQIVGEHPFQVPPLPIPATGLAPAELLRVESVQLFHDRARSARPNFRVTKANAPALTQLCARLEGSPLAIELCAARAGAFAPSKMLERLERRLDFLTQPAQDSTYPHATLRAALEWSYSLLWPELQQFLAALCVFRGGCTAPAAAAIAGEPHAAHWLHQLRLVSLARSSEVGGETRFDWPETVREFAREKLDAATETDLQRRHAEFFAALAQRAEPHLSGPQQRHWLDCLEVEADNARAALDWAALHAPALYLEMVRASGRFWLVRGYHAEGRRRVESALQLLSIPLSESNETDANANANADGQLSLQLLGLAAELAWYDGDFAESLSLSERGLALARARGEARFVAQALHSLAYAMGQRGDFALARPLFDQSLSLSRETHDDVLLCEVLLGATGEASRGGRF